MIFDKDKLIKECSFVALDIETTGLSPRWDAVVEIGALRFGAGMQMEEFQVFVDPLRPIPGKATAIHGITNEMVKGASSLEEALRAFVRFRGKDPLVLHNPAFDLGFLDQSMKSLDPGWLTTPVFDTCELSRKAFPGCGSYSLTSLSSRFSLSGGDHHRALEDCRYSAALFELILGVIDGFGFMTLSQLAEDYGFRS